MTGYIYNIDNRELVATLISADQSLIERTADDLVLGAETYGLTYSPAFGANGGLIETQAPEYDLDDMATRYIVYTADGKEVAEEATERVAEAAAETYDRRFRRSAQDGDLCQVVILSLADQISL